MSLVYESCVSRFLKGQCKAQKSGGRGDGNRIKLFAKCFFIRESI